MEYKGENFREDKLEGLADFKRRHALFFKVVALVVVCAFIVFDITWAQGGVAPVWQHAKPQDIDSQVKGPNGLTVPYAAGTAQDVYVNGSKRTIINIQDAHASLAAQKSIVSLLDHMVANYDLNLIAVEGSEGYIDTSILRAFPNEDARKKAAEYLMEEGLMSAGEFFSIVSAKPIALYGVESDKLYQENVESFRGVMRERARLVQNTEALERSLRALEEKVYSKELKEFLTKSYLHKEKGLSFSEYWKHVKEVAKAKRIDLDGYKNIEKLLTSLMLEEKIDFSGANDERRVLIDELSKVLTKSQIEMLVMKSLSFKMGEISQGEFHRFLIDLAVEMGINAEPFQNLIMFTRYITIYEGIDIFGLYHDVEGLEEAVREKLFANKEERTLYELRKQADILRKLFSIELANGDVEYLIKNRKDIQAEPFAAFIRDSYRKHGLVLEGDYDLTYIMENIDEAVEFYNIAKRRDEAMLKNTIARMKDEGQNVAALITGGFHTEGLVDLMKSKGLSYLVVVPKYENEKERPYVAILTGKTQGYEELVKQGKYELAVRQYYADGDPKRFTFSMILAAMGVEAKELAEALEVYEANYAYLQESTPKMRELIRSGKRWDMDSFRLVRNQLTPAVQEALNKIPRDKFNMDRAVQTVIEKRKEEIELEKKRGRIKDEAEYKGRLEEVAAFVKLLESKEEKTKEEIKRPVVTKKTTTLAKETNSPVAISGVTGFLGPNLANLLQEQGVQVTGLSRSKTSPGLSKLHEREKATIKEFDLLNPDHETIDRVMRQNGTFYHLGAMSDHRDCKERPHEALIANSLTTAILSKLAGIHGTRFIFASTFYTYSLTRRPVGTPMREEEAAIMLRGDEPEIQTLRRFLDECEEKFDKYAEEFVVRQGRVEQTPMDFVKGINIPRIPEDRLKELGLPGDYFYPLTKLLAERLVKKMSNSVIVRFSNIYGPAQKEIYKVPTYILGGRDNSGKKLFSGISELKPGETFEVWKHGARDYLYVEDCVRALQRAATVPITDDSRVINIASGKSTTNIDIARAITASIGKKVEIREGEREDKSVHICDNARFRKYLHPEELTPLSVGIDKTVKYYVPDLEQPEGRAPPAEDKPSHAYRPVSLWSLIGLGGGVDWVVGFGTLAGYVAHYFSMSWKRLNWIADSGLVILGIIAVTLCLSSFMRVMDCMRAVRKIHPELSIWRALVYDISRDKEVLDKLKDISIYTYYQVRKHESFRWHVTGLVAFLPEILSRKKFRRLLAKLSKKPDKKILLIASPISNYMQREAGRNAGYFTAPPYGLYRMKAYLEKKGLAEVEVFDPNLYPEDAHRRLALKILENSYSVVGFNLTHVNMQDELRLIDQVREAFKAKDVDPPLFVGGGHEATHNYGQWLRESYLDCVVLGYGETVLEDIIKRQPRGSAKRNKKKWLERIDGLVFYDDRGGERRNFAKHVSPERFRDITLLNEPTGIIPYQEYWNFNKGVYEPENLRVREATLKTIRLFTSSHCQNGCGFCSSSNFLSVSTGGPAPVLYLSARDTYELVLQNVRKHDPDAIFFNDDDFVISNSRETDTRKRVLEFCRIIREAKQEGHIRKDVRFYIQTKARNVTNIDRVGGTFIPDYELLEAMREAGVALIALGIESFSDKVLKGPAVFKKTTKNMSVAAIKGIVDAGITPLANIIFLSPDETKEDFLETANEVLRLTSDGVQFSVNTHVEYFPGSPVSKRVDKGEYPHTFQKVFSQKTGRNFDIPVHLKPKDPQMALVAEKLEGEREKILTELQMKPEWTFKYPPQVINGLISFMAALSILVDTTVDRREVKRVQAKAKAFENAIMHRIQMAMPTAEKGELLTPQQFKHLVERAHTLIKEPRMTFEKASDLVVIAGELKGVWPNTYDRIIDHLSGFLEENMPRKDMTEQEKEIMEIIANGLSRMDIESERTERILALLNFFLKIDTPILENYYVDEENIVSFVPDGDVVDEPEAIDNEFLLKNVMIFEPHHDDALTFIGNLMEKRIIPNAQKTTLVTVVNDSEGVEDSYASGFAGDKKFEDMDSREKDRLKMSIRRQEGLALADAIGIGKNYLSFDDRVPLKKRVTDEKGRLLSYQSVFEKPGRALKSKLRKKIFREQPDIIVMPLPRGSYHQNHRDTARVITEVTVDYNKMRAAEGKPPVRVYLYSANISKDGFVSYGIDPNAVNYFSSDGDERKKQLFSECYKSQTHRFPRYMELLHRLNMEKASVEAEKWRHLEKEPGDLYAETLLRVEVVPSEIQRKKEKARKEKAIENSINIITGRLMRMEEEYMRIHIFDGNVFFETPDAFDFLPVKTGQRIAGEKGLLEKLGLTSIIIDKDRAFKDWDAFEKALREAITALMGDDADALVKLLKGERSAIRAETFSKDTEKCTASGITPIYLQDIIRKKIKGKEQVKVTMHQPGYQKYLGFFHKMRQADIFVSTDTNQYVDKEWMNRQNFRDSSGGRKWLSVPLIKGHVKDRTVDKRIDSSKQWQKSHWSALRHVYAEEPYFARYARFFEELYKRDWTSLNNLNEAMTRYLLRELGIKDVIFVRASCLGDVPGRKAGFISNVVERILGREIIDSKRQEVVYVSGRGALAYLAREVQDGTGVLERDVLPKRGINLNVQEYKPADIHNKWGIDPYNPTLEILFQIGPKAREILDAPVEVTSFDKSVIRLQETAVEILSEITKISAKKPDITIEERELLEFYIKSLDMVYRKIEEMYKGWTKATRIEEVVIINANKRIVNRDEILEMIRASETGTEVIIWGRYVHETSREYLEASKEFGKAGENIVNVGVLAPDKPTGRKYRYEFLGENELIDMYVEEGKTISPELAKVDKDILRKSGFLIMAAGAGTRLASLGDMSFEDKVALGIEDITPEDIGTFSKPTVPFTKVMKKNPFQLMAESLAAVARDSGVDIPFIIVCTPVNKGSIIDTLKENKNFGLKHIILVEDFSGPPVFDAKGRVTVRERDLLHSGGGTGGALRTLNHKGITLVDIDGNVHDVKYSSFEWLETYEVEDLYFAQCDMAYTPELLRSMVAAKSKEGEKRDLVALGYSYPPGSDYKLGTILRRSSEGKVDFEVVEWRDRTPQINDLIGAAEKGTRIPAYAGVLGIDLAIAKRIVTEEPGKFVPYIHWNKRESLEDGTEVVVNKIQYSLTDLFQNTDSVGVVMVPFQKVAPMKDPQKLSFVRATLMEEHKDFLRSLGVTIDDGAGVEISPLARFNRVGKNVSITGNTKVYFGGGTLPSCGIEIGDNVTFKENATVKILGGSPVVIGKNVTFRGEGEVVLENPDGETLIIPDGAVIETGKDRSPRQGLPIISIINMDDGHLLSILPAELNREHIKRTIDIFDILWDLGGKDEDRDLHDRYRDIFHKFIIAQAMGSPYGTPEMLKPAKPVDDYYRILGRNNIVVTREMDLFLRFGDFRDKKKIFQKINEARFDEDEKMDEKEKQWLKKMYVYFVVADLIERGADYLKRVEAKELKGEAKRPIEEIDASYGFAREELEKAGINAAEYLADEAVKAMTFPLSPDFARIGRVASEAAKPVHLLQGDGEKPDEDGQPRGSDGRYGRKPGGSPDDVMGTIALNDKLLRLAELDSLTISAYRIFERRVSESTNRRDFESLTEEGLLRVAGSERGKISYGMTGRGYRRVFEIMLSSDETPILDKDQDHVAFLEELLKSIRSKSETVRGYVLEGLVPVLTEMEGERTEAMVAELAKKDPMSEVKEAAAVVLAQWCSYPGKNQSRAERARAALEEALGGKRLEIFDKYGVCVIDIRVDKEHKFTEEDLDRIEKALAAVPNTHLGSDVVRVILKTYSEEYSERLPSWISESKDLQDLAERIKILGTYEKDMRIVRINDTREVERTIFHEVGHGVYFYRMEGDDKFVFSSLHNKSAKMLAPEDRRHSVHVDYSDFAYPYGAVDETEDFATIYECLLAGRRELSRRARQVKSSRDTDFLERKIKLLELIFPPWYEFRSMKGELLPPIKVPTVHASTIESLQDMLKAARIHSLEAERLATEVVTLLSEFENKAQVMTGSQADSGRKEIMQRCADMLIKAGINKHLAEPMVDKIAQRVGSTVSKQLQARKGPGRPGGPSLGSLVLLVSALALFFTSPALAGEAFTACRSGMFSAGALIIALIVITVVSFAFDHVSGGGSEEPLPEEIMKLISQLKDGSKKVRAVAVRMLGKTGDPRVAALLARALNDKDPGVRLAAAEALGNIGGKDAVEALSKKLYVYNWEMQEAAANALTKIGTPDAAEALEKAAKSGRDIHGFAAKALAKIGHPRAVDHFTGVLEKSPFASEREAAAEILGQTEASDAVPALVEILTKDPDPAVRMSAATALGRIDHPDGVEALFKALKDRNVNVRFMAAMELRRTRHWKIVERELGFIYDDILTAYMHIGEKQSAAGLEFRKASIPALLAALRDGNQLVRESAVSVFRENIEKIADDESLLDEIKEADPRLAFLHMIRREKPEVFRAHPRLEELRQEAVRVEEAAHVEFCDHLGHIAISGEIARGMAGALKQEIEKVVSGMPGELVEEVRFELSYQDLRLKVEHDPSLGTGRIVRTKDELIIYLGDDQLVGKRGPAGALTLRDFLAEAFVSLLLDDYDSLKKKSKTDVNAYFKLENIKVLLNYPVSGDSRYQSAINGLTREWNKFTQRSVFFSVMDDTDPFTLVAGYLRLLSKRVLFTGKENIYGCIERVRVTEISGKMNIAAIRNVLKEFFLGGKVSIRLRDGRVVEKTRFGNFDDTSRIAGLKEGILKAESKDDVYRALQAAIAAMLPLNEDMMREEMNYLVDRALGEEILSSPDRPRKEDLIRGILKGVLVKRIGQEAFDSMIRHLSGKRVEDPPFIGPSGEDFTKDLFPLEGMPEDKDHAFTAHDGVKYGWISAFLSAPILTLAVLAAVSGSFNGDLAWLPAGLFAVGIYFGLAARRYFFLGRSTYNAFIEEGSSPAEAYNEAIAGYRSYFHPAFEKLPLKAKRLLKFHESFKLHTIGMLAMLPVASKIADLFRMRGSLKHFLKKGKEGEICAIALGTDISDREDIMRA
ncbi:MAG: WbqC family protein, partial [Candidatus Omnitrophota bacterium]